MSGRDWLLLIPALVLAAALTLWLFRRTISLLRERLRRRAITTVFRFRTHLARYKLVERTVIRAELLHDSVVLEAIAAHAKTSGKPVADVERHVAMYIDEIVPFFNILAYYGIAYNLSRLLINFLFKPTVEYQDAAALNAIPKRDVVVYLMNHRSNADYVVVMYVLARVVSISYAVGEWARTWPLEYIFKSFGSYFIRRRFREPLYHAVLERYVQLITKNRVTQGIFPEGGLTRDGTLRPAKLGLLDYIVRTASDPQFDGDIWLVPVGLNYDRVLEDRTLIRELVIGVDAPGRFHQFMSVVRFLAANFWGLLTGRRRRYGRVAVNFGTPISLREWLLTQPSDLLDLPKEQRLPRIQLLGDLAMSRIGAVIPVTPVPFAAAALLSFGESVVRRDQLMDKLVDLRERLHDFNAKVVRYELPVSEVWDRAWRTFKARRWVVEEPEGYVILPSARPLLEYYANSIRHLLPEETQVAWTPAEGPDPSLPHLGAPKTR